MKKFLWIAALLVALALVFVGCGPKGGDDDDDDDDITWTVEQVGGTESIADSTGIRVTFSRAVADFPTARVTITSAATKSGAPAAEQGSDNKKWIIPITVNNAGSASVSITSAATWMNGKVKAETKNATVYKEGEENPITWNAVADGEEDTTTSTKITFTFSEAVTGLTADDITFATIPALTGAALKGNVTQGADAKKWDLAVTVSAQGKLRISVAKTGFNIESGTQDIDVWMDTSSGPVIESGENANWKWTALGELEPEDDATEADIAAGKGNIVGDDFDMIVEATKYKGTYLRVYVDKEGDDAWPGAGIGNSDGGRVQFNYADATGGYYDVPLKTLKNYYEVDDEYIFVNPWNGCIILGIVLYEPKPAELEEVLPEGVTEFTLPSADGTPGKGSYGGFEINALNNAPPGSYLEIDAVADQALGNNHGFGELLDGNNGWGASLGDPGKALLTTAVDGAVSAGDDFTFKIMVSDIKALFTGGTITGLTFNLYNGVYFTKMWLVEDPNYTFVPVTSVTVTSAATANAGTPYNLTASVEPGDATVKLVSWEITEDTSDIAELNGIVLTFSDPGTVKVKATVVGGGAGDTDVSSDEFTITVEDALAFPEFDDAVSLGMWDSSSRGWTFATWNNDFDDFFAANYLIIATIGGGTNKDGFGGMQFGIQGDGDNDWTLDPFMDAGDWTGFAFGDGWPTSDVVYFVFDLTKFAHYDAENFGDQVQFVVNYGADLLGNFVAYLPDAGYTFTAGVGDGEIKDDGNKGDETGEVFGWITRDPGLTEK